MTIYDCDDKPLMCRMGAITEHNGVANTIDDAVMQPLVVT